jgi:hypothetical protein
MMSINSKASFDRETDKNDRVQLARGLRRIKRRLLLEHVGVAPSPPHNFEKSNTATERHRSSDDAGEAEMLYSSALSIASLEASDSPESPSLMPSTE